MTYKLHTYRSINNVWSDMEGSRYSQVAFRTLHLIKTLLIIMLELEGNRRDNTVDVKKTQIYWDESIHFLFFCFARQMDSVFL